MNEITAVGLDLAKRGVSGPRCRCKVDLSAASERGSGIRGYRGHRRRPLAFGRPADLKLERDREHGINSDRRRPPIDEQFDTGHKTGIVGSEK
jgi:hypothetical protein